LIEDLVVIRADVLSGLTQRRRGAECAEKKEKRKEKREKRKEKKEMD